MFGLTDQALSLLVGAILLTGSVAAIRTDNEDLLTTATAQYMTTVQQGLNTYASNTFQLLSGESAFAGSGVAPPASVSITVGTTTVTKVVNNPLSPTIPDLINLGILPVGFGLTSPLKLPFTTTLTPVNCPGTSCQINGMMRTATSYKDGTGKVRPDMIADVVAHAGDDAGASYSDTPSTIIGFRRSWNMPNPAGGVPAILAMRVGSSSNAPCTIFTCYTRAGLFALTGALQGGGQDVDNVKNVNAAGTATAASAALTSTGNILKLGPVNQLYSDTSNIAMRSAVAFYVQNQDGSAMGTINTGNANVTGNVTASGYAVINGQGVQGQACPTNAAVGINAATFSGLVLCTFGRWQPVGTSNNGAGPGVACGPAGTLYTDVNNVGYVCSNNGQMVPQNRMISNFTVVYKVQVQDTAPLVSKPSCPAGGTPVVDMVMNSTGVNVTTGPPYESVIYRMNDGGSFWQPQITLIQAQTGAGESGNDLGLTATAIVECQFSDGPAPGF